MRTLPLALRGVLVLAVAWLLLPTLASAQQPDQAKPAVNQAPAPGDVHVMEIYNGTMRTVHYISASKSPGEQMVLRDLEDAENELALRDRLQALRRQYVADESALEARRRTVQELLYGYSTSNYGATFGGYGLGGYGYGSPGYYGGYGFGSYPYLGVAAGGSTTSTASLANGVGDEGAIKTAMAPVLARQSTEEARMRAGQALAQAWDRVAASPTLMAALNVPARGVGVPVAQGSGAAVTVTLKNGTKVEGKLLREDGDRLVIETDNQEVEIRKSETTMIARPKSGGVAPAVQDKGKP
jgi:hypothetical protein